MEDQLEKIKRHNLHQLVGKWCLVEGPAHVDHNFTFLASVSVPVTTGEYRISLWTAYLASCHPEIKITPLEVI